MVYARENNLWDKAMSKENHINLKRGSGVTSEMESERDRWLKDKQEIDRKDREKLFRKN